MVYQFVWIFVAAIGCFTILVAGQRTSLDSPENIQALRDLRKWLVKSFGSSGSDRLLNVAKNKNRVQDYYTGPFPCNVSFGRSPEVPTSINRLRPGDIDVICAMGDSLTAGLGIFATNLLHMFAENRGASFNGGGQGTWREFLTLPNIFKEFNPNIIGYAYNDSFGFEKSTQFTAAESMAMSRDIPYMAQVLINRLKNDPRVDIKKHWKMIVLMIGANDICTDMCYLPQPSTTLLNHKNDLLKTLRLLQDQLPRTFVAVVSPPNLKTIVKMRGLANECYFYRVFLCPCLFSLVYRKQREEFFDIIDSWSYVEDIVAHYPEFHTDDFTVEVEPALAEVIWPKLNPSGLDDSSYLSPDCFHASQKTHARAANGVWNNLLQPFGEKQRNWNAPFETFLCPTEENPYLRTLTNSRTSFENYPMPSII